MEATKQIARSPKSVLVPSMKLSEIAGSDAPVQEETEGAGVEFRGLRRPYSDERSLSEDDTLR